MGQHLHWHETSAVTDFTVPCHGADEQVDPRGFWRMDLPADVVENFLFHKRTGILDCRSARVETQQGVKQPTPRRMYC